MVNSTQILTVSYGTFSCTLEGFDDPFNTMKSIAEYFRDLAADDRYFGAEPPQPDAEMLHRIAQREVNRRVEAKVADDGLVLRQIGTDAAPAPNSAAAPAPAASPAPVAQAPAAPEPKVEVLAPQPSPESVADKLGRIRAAVARARAAEDELAQTYEEDERVETGFMGSIDEAFSGPAFPDEAQDAEEITDAAADKGEGESESEWTTAQFLAESQSDIAQTEEPVEAAAEEPIETEEPASTDAEVSEPSEIASEAPVEAAAEAPVEAEAEKVIVVEAEQVIEETTEVEAAPEGSAFEETEEDIALADEVSLAKTESEAVLEMAEEAPAVAEAPEAAEIEEALETKEVLAAEERALDEPLAEFEDAELAADIADSALDAAAETDEAEEVARTAKSEDTVGADFFETVAGGDFSAADMAYGGSAEIEAEAPAFMTGFDDMDLVEDAGESDEDTLAALAAALNPADEDFAYGEDDELAALRAGLDLDTEDSPGLAIAEAAEAEIESVTEEAEAEIEAVAEDAEAEIEAVAEDAEAEVEAVADHAEAIAEDAEAEIEAIAQAAEDEIDAVTEDAEAEIEAIAAAAEDEIDAIAENAEIEAAEEATAEAEEAAIAEAMRAAHEAEEAIVAEALDATLDEDEDDVIAQTASEDTDEVTTTAAVSAPAPGDGRSTLLLGSMDELVAAIAEETYADLPDEDEDHDAIAAEAEDVATPLDEAPGVIAEHADDEDDALAALADAWESDETDDAHEDDAALDEETEKVSLEANDDEEIEIEAEDETAPQGRIIRLKRRDFEAALAAGEIEEIEDEDAVAEADETLEEEYEDTIASFAQAEAEEDTAEYDGDEVQLEDDIRNLIGQTSLSDEDEEDLLEELASVEREAKALRPAQDESADETAEYGEEEPQGDGDEDALNRLLTETNAKLGDSEGSRRRSAIAHLKAAVAATRADRKLKTDRDREEKDAMDRYRNDLAKIVRPRRPSDGAEPRAGRGRPVADILRDGVAPLMLVSEQRVDIPEDERRSSHDPVHPRRPVAEEPEDEAAVRPVSFADFAKKAGASELPDILEAAAAYATLIEGQDGVSRPQILRRAASLTGDAEISREQGLQSFGMLLRTGRIRKLGHGRFGVSEETEVAKIARAGE